MPATKNWKRFIDDIFFIWTDGEDWLKEFLVFCQKYSKTKNMKSVIKFEISHSTKTINFLDVCITLNQQTLPPSFQNPQALTSTLTLNLVNLSISETSQSHNSYVSARFSPICLITLTLS